MPAGKRVIIASGSLLQGRGIVNIVEPACKDKQALVYEFSQFVDVYRSDGDILIPQIEYSTNDAWAVIACLDKDN